MSANRILLQILAAKAGISATFMNIDTFATDGKRVYVPEWAQTLPTDVSLGFFAHEAVGHIRMTDFETRSAIPLANSVLNLLEDIRIERMIPLVFPGARRLLAETADYAATRFWQPPAESLGADPLDQSFFWLVRRLRGDVLGQLGSGRNKLDLLRIEMYLSATPGGWLDRCQQALGIAREALSKADKTADLLPAAEAIARLFANGTPGDPGNDGSPGDQGTQGNKSTQDSQENHGDSAQEGQGTEGSQEVGNRQENGNQGNGGAPKALDNNGTKTQSPGDQGAAGNRGDQSHEGSHGIRGAQGNQGAESSQGSPGHQEDLLQRQVNIDLGSLLLKGVPGKANAS